VSAPIGSPTLFKFVSDRVLRNRKIARKKMEKKEVAPERVTGGVAKEKSVIPMRCCVDCGVEVP
jgi:hypothetical protein